MTLKPHQPEKTIAFSSGRQSLSPMLLPHLPQSKVSGRPTMTISRHCVSRSKLSLTQSQFLGLQLASPSPSRSSACPADNSKTSRGCMTVFADRLPNFTGRNVCNSMLGLIWCVSSVSSSLLYDGDIGSSNDVATDGVGFGTEVCTRVGVCA